MQSININNFYKYVSCCLHLFFSLKLRNQIRGIELGSTIKLRKNKVSGFQRLNSVINKDDSMKKRGLKLSAALLTWIDFNMTNRFEIKLNHYVALQQM